MKSLIAKRSVMINGHKTSVSLEDPFWSDLKKIAHTQQATTSKVIANIDATRQHGNLSSAIRLFVLEHFQTEHKRVDVTEAHRTSESAEGTHDSGFDEPR